MSDNPSTGFDEFCEASGVTLQVFPTGVVDIKAAPIDGEAWAGLDICVRGEISKCLQTAFSGWPSRT